MEVSVCPITVVEWEEGKTTGQMVDKYTGNVGVRVWGEDAPMTLGQIVDLESEGEARERNSLYEIVLRSRELAGALCALTPDLPGAVLCGLPLDLAHKIMEMSDPYNA